MQLLKPLALAVTLVTGLAAGGAAVAQEAIPVEEFALLPAMSNVSLSPNGEYIAYLIKPSLRDPYIVEIREVDDLSARPVRIGGDRMEVDGVSWLNDERLLVDFRQQFRDDIEDVNDGVWASKRAIINRDGRGRWLEMPDDASLRSRLLDDPDHILVYTANYSRGESLEGRAISDLRTPDFQLYNVNNGRMSLVLRGNDRLGGYIVDREGNIRGATEVDGGAREVIYYSRDIGGSEWREVFRNSVDNVDVSFSFMGFDPADPDIAFVTATNGHDTTGVYEFNVRTGNFGSEIFRAEGVDIAGAWRSTAPDRLGEIVGFVYYQDGQRRVAFMDAGEQQLYDQIEATFPGTEPMVLSRSRDGNRMIIYVSGPRNPGAYYLLDNGQLSLLGSRNPLLSPEDLSDVEFVRYTARDGRSIPGYLTVPSVGEAPYPLVVLPHGGPWVSEHINWDEWGQLLANRGYMVLQPGYRGTEGYGIDHWTSSFAEWGQAMQDDLDDGAQFLVNEGLVDPDQVAIFGWSYGGYAAFAASVRNPSPYQCSIAGAGVSDMTQIRSDFTQSRLNRLLLRTAYRGLNPVDHAAEVEMPLLIIHGEVDQRVPIVHSERFVRALDRAGVDNYRYVVLERADHFSNTLSYDNKLELYSELLAWLAGPCGMPPRATVE